MTANDKSPLTVKTPAQAVAALHASILDFHTRAEHGILRWRYEDSIADNAMQLAFGIRGSTARLLASNKVLRQRAGELLIRRMTREQRSAPSSRTWYFMTFLDDRAFLNSYRPQVDIRAFKRRVDALVRSSGFNAICAMELQALTNYPGHGQGRTLMLNAHAIGFTDALFDMEAVERRLRTSTRLQHQWNVPTVDVQQIGIDGSPIAWPAYYLLKAPHIAKYRVWDSGARPPGYRLKDTSMRADVAVRLMEFLSRVTFNEMVWGVRAGSGVLKAWRDELQAWAASYRPSPVRLNADFDMAELWRETRALNGNPRLQPFRFLDRGDAPYETDAAEIVDKASCRKLQRHRTQRSVKLSTALERFRRNFDSLNEL